MYWATKKWDFWVSKQGDLLFVLILPCGSRGLNKVLPEFIVLVSDPFLLIKQAKNSAW